MGIFVEALKNDLVDYDYGNKDIVTSYNLGDGNHNVKLEGNNTSVRVGNGNSQISVDGDECAVLAGDGDHSISSVGDYNKVKTGNGNNSIEYIGNGGIVSTENGNQSIVSIGDGNVLKTGSGDDDVLMLGKYNVADFSNGDNNIVFYGNGSSITTGDGNDSVTTLDQVINDPAYADYKQEFENRLDTQYREKWTLIKSQLLNVSKHKHTFKTTIVATYLCTYDVETFKDKIAGVKKAQINTGGGSDKINITVSKDTKIKTDKTEKDEINKRKKYIYSTESLGVRRETKIQQTSHSSWRGGAIGGVIGAVVGTVCPGIGTIIGTCIGAGIGKASNNW